MTSSSNTTDFQSAQHSPVSMRSKVSSSWCTENGAPFDSTAINAIFVHLGNLFGFQMDNVTNMFEYFMSLLDSRASRMSCAMALLSVHADYIGGDSANYKHWYFAAYYDLDKDYTEDSDTNKKWSQIAKYLKGESPTHVSHEDDRRSLWAMDYKWRLKMSQLSDSDHIYQVALYLLIWGEANNVRFMPECLCFIFKCALDYYLCDTPKVPLPEYAFLENTITPLYNFIRDQQLVKIGGNFVRKPNRDHSDIIGYDDVNLFFWHPKNLQKLALDDGTLLHSYAKSERYGKLNFVNWEKSFKKTYLEKRSWVHLFVNFNRIWISHLSVFWYFISLNCPSLYTKNYETALETPPAPQVQLAVISFGGVIACLMGLFGLLGEWYFLPRSAMNGERLGQRITILCVLLVVNFAPTAYIFIFKGWDVYSRIGIIVGISVLIFSIMTTVYLSIVPSRHLFSLLLGSRQADHMKSQLFTSNFATATSKSNLFSCLLWICVFLAKLSESYFFLALSMKDPLRILITMDLNRCAGDVWLKKLVCQNFALFAAFLLVSTNFILFFLDAYLWYIICNCVFSAVLSYSQGTSIFKPWKSKFGKLPERILTKIYYHGVNDGDSSFAISKIWNCIIISLYKEHLLSIEQAKKLVYQQEDDYSSLHGPCNKAPIFFNYQEDYASAKLSDFFATNEEASRRISFFARSLSSQLPPPTPIESIPSFTVLAPHFSENIILGLKELLKENKSSKISLIEYLKKLHPLDWKLFVKDSKLSNHITSASIPETANSGNVILGGETKAQDRADFGQSQLDDIPFDFIGFKFSQPEFSMRTRLWASLRYQTLFRTISGFYNYERALKILYFLEVYNNESEYLADEGDMEQELNQFAKRKFRLLVSMQKYQDFGIEEQEAVSVLFENFPDLQVSYLEKEVSDGATTFYSVLLLGSGKERVTRFRIKLSGNPILGDGKADNQNNAIIFHRGEYLQTIDANQDNYIEECLKIRSVLSEFNEIDLDPTFEYVPGMSNVTKKPRVAMLGAREYIFSESIGVLGDVTAGKEQTFGTLFARTLSVINAKLHYGHPDFINGIFMCTRGGISKAQKGLHLNEDIYAGMNAVCRGGIIKHCDYYQCGKGRDLGFDTILNFTTKIGAGMGEQMLSREVFNMGTSLRVDRFLSFYYAHAGFHVNNVFIMYSVNMFMIVLTCLGALKYETIMCSRENHAAIIDPLVPFGCYNLMPVLDWVNRFVLSMFICLSISFLPLVVQEFTEKGLRKTTKRIGLHFLSLAPLFEVVVCKVYAKAFIDNIHFGGAQYVPTGRGIATTRNAFSVIFSKYAHVSIYPGSIGLLVVVFATMSMWQPALLWFYLTFLSLNFAPFIFNPHQFCFSKFVLDYGVTLHWLFGGNTRKSGGGWAAFKRSRRSKFTGSKKNKRIIERRETTIGTTSFKNLHLDLGTPFLEAFIYLMPYLFINSQTGVLEPVPVNPLLRIFILSFLPITLSVSFNVFILVFNLIFGRLLLMISKKLPGYIATTSHILSVFLMLITIEVNFFLHKWNVVRTICSSIVILRVHSFLLKVVYVLVLTKEYDGDEANSAWWSGQWSYKEFGWCLLTQPFRELIVKTVELCMFGYDFVLIHFLLNAMAPLTLLPFVDRVHTSMLFWMKPKMFKDPISTTREKRMRKYGLVKYLVLYMAISGVLMAVVLTPIFSERISTFLEIYIPDTFSELFQPNFQNNNDTGSPSLLLSYMEMPLRTVP